MENIVTIISSDLVFFPWKPEYIKPDEFTLSGSIFKYNNKNYIMTSRFGTVGNKEILVFHYLLKGKTQLLYVNKCYVVYQNMEFNISILATVDCEFFNINMSMLLLKNNKLEKIEINDALEINEKIFEINERIMYSECTSETKCKVINLIVILNKYKLIENDVKYIGKHIDGNYFHVFDVADKQISFFSPIINKKNKMIIGFTLSSIENNLKIVMPIQTIVNMIKLLIENKNLKLYTFPIPLTIDKNNEIVSSECSVLTHKTSLCLPANLHIKKINDFEVKNIKNTIMIFDEKYFDYIPLEIFINSNFSAGNVLTVSFVELPQLNVNVVPVHVCTTTQKSFKPSGCIEYYNFMGIYITLITEEFINLLKNTNVTVKNKNINDYMNGETKIIVNEVVIVDCDNSELQKKYNLPILKENGIVEFPVIKKINKIAINGLTEISKIVPLTVSVIETDEYIMKL